MTRKQFTLQCEPHLEQDPAVALRTIQESDQADLRTWKNLNRQYFFFKELISESMQQEWFGKYLARDDDYMFIVQAGSCSIGCVGIRALDDMWDVYNVILGDPAAARKGYMSQALQAMCKWAIELRPMRVSAKVLKDNPALAWYRRNGFRIVSTHDDYVGIEWDETLKPGGSR